MGENVGVGAVWWRERPPADALLPPNAADTRTNRGSAATAATTTFRVRPFVIAG